MTCAVLKAGAGLWDAVRVLVGVVLPVALVMLVAVIELTAGGHFLAVAVLVMSLYAIGVLVTYLGLRT